MSSSGSESGSGSGSGSGSSYGAESAETPWRFFIDTGGTFTDCIAIDPGGTTRRVKVLSSGVLRARVLEAAATASASSASPSRESSPNELQVRLPDFVGARALQGMRAGDAVVERFDPRDGRVRFDRPVSAIGPTIDFAADEEPPILAARLLCDVAVGETLPPIELRLATTRGTNALLERRVARTALIATRGFGDMLEIGDQRRAELFALTVRKPEPLTRLVIEVDERCDASGAVIRPLLESEVARVVADVRASGAQSVAVVCMHAWRNPAHEIRLARALRDAGFQHVHLSSADPLLGLRSRAISAVVDAALGPLLDTYFAAVEGRIAARGASAVAADGGTGTGSGAGSGPGLGLGSSSTVGILTSAANLVPVARCAPRQVLLSGPAGGALGAAAAARASGHARAIAFDMGGTSTDVSRISAEGDGRPRPMERLGHRVGDVELSTPAIAIETVAAGGGSIIRFDEGHLRVGPTSAGADPGPACYGRGGPLTLTDANLLLGRFDPSRMALPIAIEAAYAAATSLRRSSPEAAERFPTIESLLLAAVRIADEHMADAIASVSVRQGVDPRDHALVAFGGAGGLHAVGVAERLGIGTIILPPDAGLLSAVGLADATFERTALRMGLFLLEDRPVLSGRVAVGESSASGVPHTASERLAAVIADARAGAEALLRSDDHLANSTARGWARVRLLGQESAIEIAFDCIAVTAESLCAEFRERYRLLYGHAPSPRPIELESVRVSVAAAGRPTSFAPSRRRPSVGSETGRATTRLGRDPEWLGLARHAADASSNDWLEAEVVDLDALAVGESISGPALLASRHSSALLPPGWTATLDQTGAAVLERADGATPVETSASAVRSASGGASGVASPAVSSRAVGRAAPLEEIICARIESFASEMGELLRRTAVSVNVKERLDFSCGVLDSAGRLVANAPHVPVHLGALGACVRSVAKLLPPRPGDVFITNHPAFGGSHLPDITVITPIFDGESLDALDSTASPTRQEDRDDSRATPPLLAWVASRAHHAELGGTRPGSMPPDARTLAEEAVVIAPMRLVERGESRRDALVALLRDSRLPTRALEENLADIDAAVAANRHGARRLHALAAEIGTASLAEAFNLIEARAERAARRALSTLPLGRHEAVERLDDGAALAVVIEIAEAPGGATARIDFTGSAGVHPANFNATEAIVRSVVMYVIRLLVREALPLNEGLLRPVSVHVPSGMLRPMFRTDPALSPAVGAGNTETSQRLTDVLLKALGVSAAGQGTMNNLLFGVDAGPGRFGYYETIGGGAGATADGPGASGVHTHMTNTRITDAEVLEQRLPVRLEEFSIRRGSGGIGLHRGGDGLRRAIRFLTPMSVSLVSQRRGEGPFGCAGGDAGAPGTQRVRTRNHAGEAGAENALPGCCAFDVAEGDVVIIETPGGGGFGAPRRI